VNDSPARAGVESTTRGVSIAGVVTAVPKNVVTNDDFRTRFSAEDIANVAKMIGVTERRRVPVGQTTSDLCEVAARRLLDSLGWNKDDVGVLVFVSQSPDYVLPATACTLQSRLALPIQCASFDVNLGCSGYVYGLWLVASLMAASNATRALLLVGDTGYYNDPADRATAMVFGDAGSATALEKSSASPAWRFVLGTNGEGAKNLIVHKSGTRQASPDDPRMEGRDPAKLYMDGGEIFNFTLSAVPPLAKQLFGDPSAVAAYDVYLFHQANTFMIRHLVKKLKLDPAKVPMNMERFGNASSASIPLLMSDIVSPVLKSRENRLALFGFGVGYSWAAADIHCGPIAVAEVVET
jgi:3-oxoacyl-[acyl-carrier-protein] synthase-3